MNPPPLATPPDGRSGADAPPATPWLSIVVPVFNEEQVVAELVRRCVAAASATGRPFELLLVDDQSRDATPTLLAEAAALDLRVVHVRLDINRGQFGATQEGLRRARGEVVAVLDGDLQDPPELLPKLVEARGERPADDPTVVFAVKAKRDDPLWFRVGRAGYQLLQSALGAAVPSGAGAFCLMPAALAKQAASVPVRHANLAPVLVALGAKASTVPYEKVARYDDRSRVGPVGLAREALGSLLLLSPAGARRLGPAGATAGLHPHGWGPLLAGLVFVLPLLAVVFARFLERFLATWRHAVFANDDWEWLWFGQSFDRFLGLLDPVGRDVFRPTAWALYALFPAVFGVTPVPLALFHLLLGALGSTLIGLVLRRVGFGWPVALLAAIAAWAHPAYMGSTRLISINEVTLSRTFAAAIWLLFLGDKAPRARLWGPLFLLGALSHESFIAVVPVLVLLSWTRGGIPDLRRLAANGEFRRLLVLWFATYAIRVGLYTTAPHGSHVLTLQAIERNVMFFVVELGRVFTGVRDAGVPTLFNLAFAALGAALLLSRRFVWGGVALTSWAVLHRGLGGAPGGPLAWVAIVVWVGFALARLRREPGTWRGLAFMVVFPVVTYAPFVLQRDYVSAYFLHFAILGGTLAAAWMLPTSFAAGPWRALPSALVLAVASVAWLPEPTTSPLFPDRLPERLIDAVRTQLPPPGGPETTVLFVEHGDATPVQDGYIELRAPWLSAIGSAFAWGPDGRALDRMNPVPAFDFSFPEHRLRVRVLEATAFELACAVPADLVVSLHPLPPDPELPELQRWEVKGLPAQGRDDVSLPPALVAGTPAFNAVEASLAAEAGDATAARAVLESLRALCTARRQGERDAADDAARRIYLATRAFPDRGSKGRARDARLVAWALGPNLLEGANGELLPKPDKPATHGGPPGP